MELANIYRDWINGNKKDAAKAMVNYGYCFAEDMRDHLYDYGLPRAEAVEITLNMVILRDTLG